MLFLTALQCSQNEIVFVPLTVTLVSSRRPWIAKGQSSLTLCVPFLWLSLYSAPNGKLKIPQRQAYLAPLYYYDESAINTLLIVLLL